MKILFVHKSMNMGGIEKSLVSLTNELAEANDVSVLLLNDTFGKDLFNNKIEFIKSNKIFRFLNPKKTYTKMQKSFIGFAKKLMKIVNIRAVLEKFASSLKVTNDEFDIAVAFHGEDYITCTQVANKVKAKKKFVFLHFDVSMVKIKKRVLKIYKEFDKIICVSRSCAEIFRNLHPELANKVDYLYNICDEDEINKKSNEFDVNYPKDCLNIISVSRLSKEKGYLESLQTFNLLKQKGYKFCWHIVGDGEERPNIENFIGKNNMQDYVKLYGNQSNPYPYFKNADLFYLGSIHESFGISMIEAMILKIPVLTSKTISSCEVVGDYGFICDWADDEIYRTLELILKNPNILNEKKLELENYHFDKKTIIDKFLAL